MTHERFLSPTLAHLLRCVRCVMFFVRCNWCHFITIKWCFFLFLLPSVSLNSLARFRHFLRAHPLCSVAFVVYFLHFLSTICIATHTHKRAQWTLLFWITSGACQEKSFNLLSSILNTERKSIRFAYFTPANHYIMMQFILPLFHPFQFSCTNICVRAPWKYSIRNYVILNRFWKWF